MGHAGKWTETKCIKVFSALQGSGSKTGFACDQKHPAVDTDIAALLQYDVINALCVCTHTHKEKRPLVVFLCGFPGKNKPNYIQIPSLPSLGAFSVMQGVGC